MTKSLKMKPLSKKEMDDERMSRNDDDFDLRGYDVVKREPEIKACPYCGHSGLTHYDWLFTETKEVAFVCRGCGMRGAPCRSLSEAIEAWNALPRKVE